MAIINQPLTGTIRVTGGSVTSGTGNNTPATGQLCVNVVSADATDVVFNMSVLEPILATDGTTAITPVGLAAVVWPPTTATAAEPNGGVVIRGTPTVDITGSTANLPETTTRTFTVNFTGNGLTGGGAAITIVSGGGTLGASTVAASGGTVVYTPANVAADTSVTLRASVTNDVGQTVTDDISFTVTAAGDITVAGETDIFEQTATTYTATTTNPTGATVTWSVVSGGGNITAGGAYTSADVTDGATQTVVIRGSFTDNTNTIRHDNHTITVHGNPTISLSGIEDPIDVGDTDTFTVTRSASTTSTVTSSDTTIATIANGTTTTPSFTGVAGGDITITATATRTLPSGAFRTAEARQENVTVQSANILTNGFTYSEDADNRLEDESQWKGVGTTISTGLSVPNNGNSNTDTVTSAWADPTAVTVNPTFFANRWPNDGSAYAGWEVGVTVTLNDAVAGTDFILIDLYDLPTYNGPSTGLVNNANPPSPNTDQALWTTVTIGIRGSTSGITCFRTLNRTAGTFIVANGYVEADTVSTTTARHPPHVRWNYSAAGDTMAATFTPSLTTLTLDEPLTLSVSFA